MRIWDIAPEHLCRQHLLGEHRELHALWSILTNNKQGYRHHPETKRWEGRLGALYIRHEALLEEMIYRGYNHNSPLDKRKASGKSTQSTFIDSAPQQKKMLTQKQCPCFVGLWDSYKMN